MLILRDFVENLYIGIEFNIRIMISLHSQYSKDVNGNNLMVVLAIDEFEKLLEQLEDEEDVWMYDQAKKKDTGERIPFDEVIRMIEEKLKKNCVII